MRHLLVGLVAVAAIVAACSSSETTSTPVIASVTMVPVKDTVLGGDTMLIIPTAQLAAVVKDASGNVLSVVQTGQPVTWTSSNTTLGVSPGSTAAIKGVKVGSLTIAATIAGVSGTASVKVQP